MDIKLEKKEAARFLGQRGRRIDLLFFGLILIFVWMAPIFLYNYVAYLVSTILIGVVGDMTFTKTVAEFLSAIAPTVGVLVSVAFLIFVTLPVMHRFFSFSYRMHRQGIAGGYGFFSGGSSFFKSMCLGSVSSGVLIVCLALPVVCYKIGKLIMNNPNETIAMIGKGLFSFIVILGIALGFCAFLLFRVFFLYGYFSARGEKVGTAIKKSCKIMKTQRAKQLYKSYIKAFVPSLLLALPTFLVWFFVDTLPKMIIVYYKVCDELLYGENI